MSNPKMKECPKCHTLTDDRTIVCPNDYCDYIFVPEHGTHVDPTRDNRLILGIYPVGTGDDGRNSN